VAGALLLGTLHWTLVFLPVVFAPFMIFTLGAVWFTSALAVYWRDLTEVAPIIITMLMFLSPIFYPLEAVPQAFRGFIMLNPLAFVIGQVRTIVLWGQPPDFAGLALYTACALAICWAGFAWFQKSRKGFADVL
jgi:lipopolysaccharide transport system permease protein